ncbi:hypothetical protein Lesp02_53150 [Lentzea sp. NBRC 105346]|uniref:hypothetical protein n=1 Tax=Lentzea sp. NBRC 105346 TaxID=3032205 RepID=UPI0024A5D220|nr:hypothetical protein [Lentzea sp. NBRC 105346]GLZ33127.1 hypothetical protein Lesp02_53150 [Lentzea sp. NBRC 105346]
MDDSYVTFLVLGVLLVAVDGQLIYHSGQRYLRKAYEPAEAAAMMRLATVLFHLVVLGLLALVSIIDVHTGDPVKDVVVKLGVVLLLLALCHAVTMAILSRIRERQLQRQLADEMAEEHRIYEERHSHIAEPQVIEQRQPYS